MSLFAKRTVPGAATAFARAQELCDDLLRDPERLALGSIVLIAVGLALMVARHQWDAWLMRQERAAERELAGAGASGSASQRKAAKYRD